MKEIEYIDIGGLLYPNLKVILITTLYKGHTSSKAGKIKVLPVLSKHYEMIIPKTIDFSLLNNPTV